MNLLDLLHQVMQIKGVTGAAVVNAQGEILESVMAEELELSYLGNIIATGMASSYALAKLLNGGEIVQTVLEYEAGPILLTPLNLNDSAGMRPRNQDAIAVVTLDSSSSLGRARFKLRKLLPQIAETVALR
ncbi:MAG: roadblock/LC7 domain-containing protein [Deinococcales bacterium]